MSSQYYNFFDTVRLELRGDGGRLTEQFPQMYSHFSVEDPAEDPDIVCAVTDEEPDPDTVLGNSRELYGRDGNRFVVRTGSQFLTADADWEHIEVSPNWEPFRVVYPVEFVLRQRMAAEGRALIHGSSLQLDGETYLFPAWRSAGKTNTMLSLMEAGADYLADDRLWVGPDGSAVGYPLAVNLEPYNTTSFPNISNADEQRERRARISNFIDEKVEPDRSFLDKVVRFVNMVYISPEGRDFTDLGRLMPGSEHVERADIDHVVVLRAAPGRSTIDLRRIPEQDALQEIRAISHYEWNAQLEEYFAAFDALFPDGDRSRQLDELREEELRIFSELLGTAGTHRAMIPREEDWRTTGLTDSIVDELRGLEDATPAAPERETEPLD